MPDLVSKEEAATLSKQATAGFYGTEFHRDHRTITAQVDGRLYTIAECELSTGDAKLFHAADRLAHTVVSLHEALDTAHARIAELDRLAVSLAKATAKGRTDREAEIVAWLRSQLTALPWSVAAEMIERGAPDGR